MNRVRTFLKQMFSFNLRWTLIMLGLSAAIVTAFNFLDLYYFNTSDDEAEVLATQCLLCGVPIIILLFNYFSAVATKSFLPTLILIFGLVFFAKVIPPFPIPDTPEKLYFLEHRTDYEAAVEYLSDYQPRRAPELPEVFSHLTIDRWASIYDDNRRGRVIYFYPFNHSYLIAYVEDADRVGDECNAYWEFWTKQPVDNNWYVCDVDGDKH